MSYPSAFARTAPSTLKPKPMSRPPRQPASTSGSAARAKLLLRALKRAAKRLPLSAASFSKPLKIAELKDSATASRNTRNGASLAVTGWRQKDERGKITPRSLWEFHMSCCSQTETSAAFDARRTFSLRIVSNRIVDRFRLARDRRRQRRELIEYLASDHRAAGDLGYPCMRPAIYSSKLDCLFGGTRRSWRARCNVFIQLFLV